MITFKEFLNERVTTVKPTAKTIVSLYDFGNMILRGESIDDVEISENDITGLFYNCHGVKSLPLFGTSKVTIMNYTFESCEDLETIPEFNTSNVKEMQGTFKYCYRLKHIPHLDTSNVTNMKYTFDYCKSIQTIERPSDWYKYDWNSKDAPQHLKDKYPELYNKELR